MPLFLFQGESASQAFAADFYILIRKSFSASNFLMYDILVQVPLNWASFPDENTLLRKNTVPIASKNNWTPVHISTSFEVFAATQLNWKFN